MNSLCLVVFTLSMLSLGDVCKQQVVKEASHLNARSNFKDFKACDQFILLRFVKSFNLQVAYKMYMLELKATVISYSNCGKIFLKF